MARKASVSAMSSTGIRLEVSFDGGQSYRQIFGVYDVSTSGGDAQTEQRTPLDVRSYSRSSQRGSQDLNFNIDNLSWMEGIRMVEEKLDSDETFSTRIVRPEIVLADFAAGSNVTAAIAANSGVVSFAGSGTAPDLFEDPYGIGNGIQIAGKMHIIDNIYTNGSGAEVVNVAPVPANAVAAAPFKLVRPGCIFGPAEVSGGNLSDVFANSGSAQQSGVFHLSGRIGSPTLVIGLV